MKLRQTSLLTTESNGQQLQLASIDNDVASHREHGADNAGMGGRELGDQFRLLQFRSLFDSQEAMRLLSVYQEVIGDFHPVIDINGLMAQAQRWYAEDNSPWSLSPEGGGTSVDQDLVILNLALAIALRAESTSSVSEVERYITENCQGAANARITAPVSSVKQVTIALLSVRSPLSLLHSSSLANAAAGLALLVPRRAPISLAHVRHRRAHVDGAWISQRPRFETSAG